MGTLLFDFDDTLAHTEELAFAACAEVVNELLDAWGAPSPLTPEQLRGRFAGCTFRAMALTLAAEHRQSLAPAALDQLVIAEEDRVIAALTRAARPTPGAPAMLAEVASRDRLALVSSSATRRLEACLAALDLAAHFPPSLVFSAATSLPTPSSKPSPAIYLHALAALAVPAAACVALEDSANGVRAATAAAIPVVGYLGALPPPARRTRAAELRAAGAFLIVEDWAAFLAWWRTSRAAEARA